MSAITLGQVQWRDRSGRRVSLEAVDGSIVARPWRPEGRSIRDWVVWASGKSNYYITKILNQFWNATSYSFPGTLYAALWTATLSKTSTGSTAGEAGASYTSYARVAVTANTTNFPASVAASNIQNGTAITFPANTGTAETCTYFAILDAATTGNMLYWGSITSTTVNAGDTPQVGIAGLSASEL